MPFPDRLRQGYFCLGLFLVPAPVFLLAGAAGGTGAAQLLPLLAALLFSLGILRLRSGRRLPAVVLSMGLCFFLALRLGQPPLSAWGWAGAVLSALAAAAYPRFLGIILSGNHSAAIWYGGLLAGGIVWAVGAMIPVDGIGELMRPFTWVYVIYLIFALTMGSLKEAAGAGRSPSPQMALRNIGAALIWTALFLLLTHLPAVSRALLALWDLIREAVRLVFDFFARLFPGEAGMGGQSGGAGMMFPAEETQPPSPFMELIEKILGIVCLILAAAALLVLLRLLAKALARCFRSLAARFRAWMNAVNADYDDHVESLLDWGEIRRDLALRRQERQRKRPEKIRWDQLSPREQVRRSYQLYLTRHPEIPESRTARQTLADPRQADIYEAARYSSLPITPEEAAFSREIRFLFFP